MKLVHVATWCGCLWLGLCSLAAQPAGELYARVRVDLSNRSIGELAALGLEVDHGQYAPGRFFASDFSDSEIETMRRAGFALEVLIPDVQAHYADPHRGGGRGLPPCEPSGLTSGPAYTVPQQFGLGSMAGFYTYQEMLDILDQMRAQYPHLISNRTPIDGPSSVEGRPIYWLRVSNNPEVDDPNKPEIFYNALHHAREPNSLTQLIFYLWYLLENYETDAEVRYLVDHTEMYFVPCINPDGYLHNQTTNPEGGGLWRKNRQTNPNGSFGVDLNRNYGFQWGFDNSGSSPNPNSEVFRGAEPFSEPETQAIRDFCNQRQFLLALNYHTFGNLLVYPWGYSDSPTPDAATFTALGRAMALRNNFLAGTGTETVGYVVNGGSDDWMYGAASIYSMTPEVGRQNEGFWPPQESILPNCLASMDINLAMARAPHNAAYVRAGGDQVYTPATDRMPVQVNRYGFSGGNFVLGLTSLDPDWVEVGTPSINLSLAPNASLDTAFALQLSPQLPSGQVLTFLLTLHNGHYTLTDTLRRIFYRFDAPVFEDTFADLGAWQSAGSFWGLDTERFYSAPHSLGDSPGAEYPANTLNAITLADPLVVGPDAFTSVKLLFQASWDIESFYDYAQLQVQVNNQPFVPVCGRYTKPGSELQDFEQPIYDGLQEAWVLEEIDLTHLVAPGDALRLRFLLNADGFVEGAGFFVDDLQLFTISPDTVVSNVTRIDATTFRMEASPNPSDGTFQLLFGALPAATSGQLVIYDLMGLILRSYELELPGANYAGFRWTMPATDRLPAGAYLARVHTASGHSQPVKLVVTR